MSAQIIELSAWRAAHPAKAVMVRVAFDPLWVWRWWLSLWVVR